MVISDISRKSRYIVISAGGENQAWDFIYPTRNASQEAIEPFSYADTVRVVALHTNKALNGLRKPISYWLMLGTRTSINMLKVRMNF